jgi:hypothetical protein
MPPLDEISLNRIESCDGSDGCDGCDSFDGFDGSDGRSDEFYGYTRLRQPNDTSTGHILDEYESSLAGVLVSIVSTPSEELGSTPSEELMSTPSEEVGSTPSEEFGSTSRSTG